MNQTLKILMMAGLVFGLTACNTATQQANPETGGDVKSLVIAEDVEYGQEDYKKIVNANNQLGMDLIAQVPADDYGNMFVSPLSLYMALSMLYNGAAGDTKAEIADVLHATISPDEMNKANASLSMMLAGNSDSVQLAISNSIWLNQSYDFQPEFAQNTQDYFNAKTEKIDVSDPESADLINGWVKDSTNGMIEKMVEKPLPKNLKTILLNAVYFNGKWHTPFEEKNTEEQPFHLADGTTVDMPFMKMEQHWSYMENDQFQAVALPYGDWEASMYVFLPKEHSSLEEFKTALTPDNWNNWRRSFNTGEGLVSLPKFEMEYEIQLNDALMALGMETAFGASDLSNMYEQGSGQISHVKQKTALKVDEKGTEAAAVTEVAIAVSSEQPEHFTLEVNRPFFVAIEDTETSTILFLGAVSNPAVE
ncbi:serpin family protein [Planococcus salinus]|uniref:Serpin family protein n=1 Tax=Planococcus salinus TaxID=1848460 RepID=A0A3M8PC55_9BACL|nr:serpin family protein [Planococcus salinus]RNF41213.1 serpin family protein [Planococcus salinus]